MPSRNLWETRNDISPSALGIFLVKVTIKNLFDSSLLFLVSYVLLENKTKKIKALVYAISRGRHKNTIFRANLCPYIISKLSH